MKPEAAALKQFQDLRPPVTQLPDSKGESLGSGRWEWVSEGMGWPTGHGSESAAQSGVHLAH